MKVWIVTEIFSDGTEIIGIFDSEEKAQTCREECIKRLKTKFGEFWIKISEWEVK